MACRKLLLVALVWAVTALLLLNAMPEPTKTKMHEKYSASDQVKNACVKYLKRVDYKFINEKG